MGNKRTHKGTPNPAKPEKKKRKSDNSASVRFLETPVIINAPLPSRIVELDDSDNDSDYIVAVTHAWEEPTLRPAVTRNGLSFQVTWQVMWPPHGHRHTATATRPPPHGHRHTATATRPPPHGHRHTVTATRPPPHGHRHTVTATRSPPRGLATLGQVTCWVTCRVMCRVMWLIMCQVVTAPLTMGTYQGPWP